MSDANRTPEPTPDELLTQIEQTRAHLAETVDALGAKADVKGRAVDAMTTDDGRPDPRVVAVSTLVAAAVVGLVVRRRRAGA